MSLDNPMHATAAITDAVWMLARLARLALCWFWAGIMLLAGLWLLLNNIAVAGDLMLWVSGEPTRIIRIVRLTAMGLIAGSQFLFMFLVADDLCPDAPMVVTGFLEFFAAALALGSLAAAAVLVWAMMP